MQENKLVLKIFLTLIILLLLSTAIIFYQKTGTTPGENIDADKGENLIDETPNQIIERKNALDKITEESTPQTQKEIESNLKILESLNN